MSEQKDFTIRKEVIWESEIASDQEVSRKEVELIRRYSSNNPSIGYNQWPKYIPKADIQLTNIHTRRLVLIPFTLEVAREIYAFNTGILTQIGLQPTRTWPDQESMDTLPRIIKRLEQLPEPTGFESWMIVLRHNATVIGDAGFKGGPNIEGIVDIGYSIIEQEQQKGYGLETARALVDWAFWHPEVKAVTANCLLENAASIRLLEKLGMLETVRDDEMIYWKLARSVAVTR
ncbi:GNAT family N-acetyltransferase [Pontibacter ramchanderi]|nr:GNAT family N-acetyltransferase [Pontibacter ramchanderi]